MLFRFVIIAIALFLSVGGFSQVRLMQMEEAPDGGGWIVCTRDAGDTNHDGMNLPVAGIQDYIRKDSIFKWNADVCVVPDYDALHTITDSCLVAYVTDSIQYGWFHRRDTGTVDSFLVFPHSISGYWHRLVEFSEYRLAWWARAAGDTTEYGEQDWTVELQTSVNLISDRFFPYGPGILDFQGLDTIVIDTTGDDPYTAANDNYCVELKSNVTIEGRGAMVMLADSMVTGLGDSLLRVNMFIARDVGNVKINDLIIDGNSSGQFKQRTIDDQGVSHYYGQTTGQAIEVYATDTLTNWDHIYTRITTQNHSGNGMNLDNIRTLKVADGRSTGMGEGWEFIDCYDIDFRGYYIDDSTNTMRGDGLEFVRCSTGVVDNVKVIGSGVQDNGDGAGSCVDMFASDDMIVSNIYAKGWRTGISFESTATKDEDSYDVEVHGLVMIDILGAAVRGSNGRLLINDFYAYNCGRGFEHYLSFSASGIDDKTVIQDGYILNCGDSGIKLWDSVTVWAYDVHIDSCGYGVRFEHSSPDFQEPKFQMFGGSILNNQSADVWCRIEQDGDATYTPEAYFHNVRVEGEIEHQNLAGDGEIKYYVYKDSTYQSNEQHWFSDSIRYICPPGHMIVTGPNGVFTCLDTTGLLAGGGGVVNTNWIDDNLGPQTASRSHDMVTYSVTLTNGASNRIIFSPNSSLMFRIESVGSAANAYSEYQSDDTNLSGQYYSDQGGLEWGILKSTGADPRLGFFEYDDGVSDVNAMNLWPDGKLQLPEYPDVITSTLDPGEHLLFVEADGDVFPVDSTGLADFVGVGGGGSEYYFSKDDMPAFTGSVSHDMAGNNVSMQNAGNFGIQDGTISLDNTGDASNAYISILRDDTHTSGYIFYNGSAQLRWAFIMNTGADGDFQLARYTGGGTYQDNVFRGYNADGDLSFNNGIAIGNETNPTHLVEAHDQGSAAAEYWIDVSTTSSWELGLSMGDLGAIWNTNTTSRYYLFQLNSTDRFKIDNTLLTSYVGHQFNDGIHDFNGDDGASGEFLSSTGTATDWRGITESDITDLVHTAAANLAGPDNLVQDAEDRTYTIASTFDLQFLNNVDASSLTLDGDGGTAPFAEFRSQSPERVIDLDIIGTTNDFGISYDGDGTDYMLAYEEANDVLVIVDGLDPDANQIATFDWVSGALVGIGTVADEELVVSGSGNTIIRFETSGTSEQAALELESGENGIGSAGTIAFLNVDADINGGARYNVGQIQISKNHATTVDNQMQFEIGYNSGGSFQTALAIQSTSQSLGGEEAFLIINAGVHYINKAIRNISTTLDDEHHIVYKTTTGAVNYTFPDASTYDGIEYEIINASTSGDITIVISGSDNINGVTTGTFFTVTPGESYNYLAITSDFWRSND